jgi:uncharacterized protein
MSLTFEWDSRKAQQNREKHGVTFEEAATVFSDPLELTIDDPDHSAEEDRFITIGESFRRRLVTVSYTERGDTIRLISARLTTAMERKAYEQSD